MTTIHTPASVDEAVQRLEVIDQLLRSKGWERAAILATIVRLPGSGGDRRSDQTREPSFESADQFVKRRLPGLRDAVTVRLYVQRWLDANGGKYPKADADVKLPDLPWPPVDPGDAGGRLSADPDKAVDQLIAKHGAKLVAKAVARPAVADAVIVDPDAGLELIHATTRHQQQRTAGRKPTSKPKGGLVGAFEKVLITLGAKAFVSDAQVFHDAVMAHDQTATPWKPAELKAVRDHAVKGRQFADDVIAVIDSYGAVTDEDLAELLGQ